MAISDELKDECAKIFRAAWTERDGMVVPDGDSMTLGNDGVNIDATVLYADLSDSTPLVDTKTKTFAAEVYKAFLRCAARVIRAKGGTIVAYDGDRIMAIFIGGSKNTNAIKAGLGINWAMINAVRPALKGVYTSSDYVPRHTVGIDTSSLMAINAGIRGSNDVAWIGRAANHAAKMCALSHDWPTRISKAVYDGCNDVARVTNGENIWTAATWSVMGDITLYRSTWSWKP